MATTISPNPAYLYGMQATARKLADHASEGKPIKLFKGEHFDSLRLTDEDLYLFLVLEGQIRCSFLFNGSPESQSLFMRGAYHAFLNENDRFSAQIGTFRYTARRNTAMVGFTKRQAALFAAEDPALFEDVMTAEHLSFLQLSYRLALGSIHSTSKRILQWLCDLCHTQKPDEDGSVVIPSNMTLEGMSDFLNVHITTLSRLLASLKQEGVLERRKGCLVIKDVGAVERHLAGENVVLY